MRYTPRVRTTFFKFFSFSLRLLFPVSLVPWNREGGYEFRRFGIRAGRRQHDPAEAVRPCCSRSLLPTEASGASLPISGRSYWNGSSSKAKSSPTKATLSHSITEKERSHSSGQAAFFGFPKSSKKIFEVDLFRPNSVSIKEPLATRHDFLIPHLYKCGLRVLRHNVLTVLIRLRAEEERQGFLLTPPGFGRRSAASGSLGAGRERSSLAARTNEPDPALHQLNRRRTATFFFESGPIQGSTAFFLRYIIRFAGILSRYSCSALL
ncbi:uncharacterized protein LOC122035348 [Zingiber officinale]|uniref:uncharacterized protein LOC122035348 n=1 Tax=Zingiber officinale TaxID=94328 RepID=UPI001C4BDDFF|nr:uncharacterized protein LOC122035348 [Zingiber officinale]